MPTPTIDSARMYSTEQYQINPEVIPSSDGSATIRGIRARAVPYGVGDGRRGMMLEVSPDGSDLEIRRYVESVFEPGVMADWLADNGDRVRFLYQHGDADQGWSASPMGLLSLPIGSVTRFEETADGLYFEAEFARHPLATWVRDLVQDQALREISFAMAPTAVELRAGADGQLRRHITAAEIYDVSIVVWGQFGHAATIADTFAAGPSSFARYAERVTAQAEHMIEQYAGAAISAANREILDGAVTDMRAAAQSLTEHADAIAALTAAPPEESGAEASGAATAAERLARLRLREVDISIG